MFPAYTSLSLSFTFLSSSSGYFTSSVSFVCVCGYFIHSFLPSVNLHEAEKRERGGIREYFLLCYKLGESGVLSSSLISALKFLEFDT